MHFDAKEHGMSKKTKILLVEDDADICSATTQVLKSVGYQIRKASSAKECMAELRADLPDLLLMDVVLPDGDGCQLCSQIKADPHLQGIFVVLLSGIKTSSNDQVMGLDLGADGFITRPVSNEELLARIQAMDRTRLAEKALQEAHDALEIRVRERTAELAKVNEQLQIEITERQRKESILRETLQRLNEAERVGNFGYRVHDVSTGEEWWSENEYAIYGLPKNVKPSYDLHLDCVHPGDRAIHDRKFKDGWESDSDWHSFEYRIVRKDGEVRNILARYRFERDTQGNPLRALGTDQDITDQKISEKILAQSRDYNRAILMSMKDHIVVLDKAGQILSANSSWFEFARKNDVSSLKLVSEGVNYLEACRRASDATDETVQKALSGIEEVLSGSQEHFALEYPCHSPSMQRWFLMNVIPFKGEKGGAVVAHTDISSRKKAEESLIESQKEARLLTRKLLKAQESERALLARELHDDITQRLAILNIEVDELEMKHPSVSRSLKKKLRKIGNDLGALSSDVHLISRQLHPSILYDLGLVKAVKIESNNFSRIYGISPTLNLDTTIKDVPKETAICMYRILQEGLKNIGKHARATHVQVRLYRENDFICLLLKDNGIGFELNSGVETAGIGLASMAERARMINAEYSIESGPGKGTAIKLKTPFTSNQN
jgi:signal transduction histidine kinase/DNA-binding response OmpR family regulator